MEQEQEQENKPYLDVKLSGRQYRRLYFETEKEKRQWQRMQKKSKLYIPYFLVGIGINFCLYFLGLDLESNIFLGALVGLGVPLSSMYFLAELHYRLETRLRPQEPESS